GRSRKRELNGVLGALAGQQRIDQAAAEAVAAADAVDDAQLILLGEAVFVRSNVIEHRAPAVVRSGMALTQGDGDLLEAELVGQLLGHALVAFAVDLAGVDVGGFGLDAEDVLGILLVGNADINILAQVGHGSAGFLTGPELAAVVQVAADLDAVGLSGLAGFAADIDNIGAQRRGVAGEVEPIDAFKDRIPVEIGGRGFLNGRVGAVIDADRTALGSALLIVIDADTVAAADNLGGIDAVAAQAVDRALADCMGRQLGDEDRIGARVGERDGHVGVA